MDGFGYSGLNLVWIFLVVLVVFLIAYGIRAANTLTKLKNKVIELDADIDVALTNRYDLLKKQYQIVKLYTSYESKTLMEVIRLRNGMSMEQRRTASGQMDLLEHQMQAVLEAYPNLRSSETVCALQKSCAEAEAHLQAARRLYNAGVTNYNNFCKAFPSSILATVLGHREAAYFQADPEKREDIEF